MAEREYGGPWCAILVYTRHVASCKVARAAAGDFCRKALAYAEGRDWTPSLRAFSREENAAMCRAQREAARMEREENAAMGRADRESARIEREAARIEHEAARIERNGQADRESARIEREAARIEHEAARMERKAAREAARMEREENAAMGRADRESACFEREAALSPKRLRAYNAARQRQRKRYRDDKAYRLTHV